MQPTWPRSFSAEVTELYWSGPQRTTKWPLNDHRVVTKSSQSLCTKAVHGWFGVYVSGVGGGVVVVGEYISLGWGWWWWCLVVGEYISLGCKGGLRQLSTSMLWGPAIPFLLVAAITASSMRCLLIKKWSDLPHRYPELNFDFLHAHMQKIRYFCNYGFRGLYLIQKSFFSFLKPSIQDLIFFIGMQM